MELYRLKNFYKKNNNPKVFLVDVFSWRGCPDEVAFTPSLVGSVKESLFMIDKALSETFEGYKGGDYVYDKWTNVHFEFDGANYDDDALFTLLNE